MTESTHTEAEGMYASHATARCSQGTEQRPGSLEHHGRRERGREGPERNHRGLEALTGGGGAVYSIRNLKGGEIILRTLNRGQI